MTVNLSEIYSLTTDNIKQKIEYMQKLGYTKEQIIRMTTLHSAIFTYTMNNMERKIADLVHLGYTKEQVIKMTYELPQIYGLTIENLKQKIFFIRKIGLEHTIIKYPKYLMQSIDLTYSRYCYLKDRGISISGGNDKTIFKGEKQFSKQFGVSKTEILQKYSYKKYVEENKNGRTV